MDTSKLNFQITDNTKNGKDVSLWVTNLLAKNLMKILKKWSLIFTTMAAL